MDTKQKVKGYTKPKLNFSSTITPVKVDPARVGVIRRGPGEKWMPNKLCVPGGKTEEVDRIVIEGMPYYVGELGAVRELEEETGIKVSRHSLKFFCTLLIPDYNRPVISFYSIVREDTKSSEVLWLTNNEILLTPDKEFAPGMKNELLLLLEHLRTSGVSYL